MAGPPPSSKRKLSRASQATPAAVDTIQFELRAPDAKEVFIAGSFNQWGPSVTRLHPTQPGNWGTELALAPGKYEYLFVVDGQWLPDPKAPEVVRNPFGGVNSILEVSSQA